MPTPAEWTRIRKRLRELRLSKPRFASAREFQKETGVKVATVQSTEEGDNHISLNQLEAWLKPFNQTIGEFFESIEEERRAERGEIDSVNVAVKPKNSNLHRKLEDILNGDSGVADWIAGNLVVFHRDYEVRAGGPAGEPRQEPEEKIPLRHHKERRRSGKRRAS